MFCLFILQYPPRNISPLDALADLFFRTGTLLFIFPTFPLRLSRCGGGGRGLFPVPFGDDQPLLVGL